MKTLHLMDRKIGKHKKAAIVTSMSGDPLVKDGDTVKIIDFDSQLKAAKIAMFAGYSDGLPSYVLSNLQFKE